MNNDQYYLDFVINTKFLSDITKKTYLKRLHVIQHEMFNIPNVSIEYILKHPDEFLQRLDHYAKSTIGPLGKPLGNHARDGYFGAIMALFTYNQQLKENNFNTYQRWKELHDGIRKPISDKYKSNEPTERQKEAYVPFDEVVK